MESKSQDIVIYHYPLRSKAHFFEKTILGGSAYESSNIHPKESGFHKRRWYASYKKGLLNEEYKKLVLPESDADNLLRTGFIEEVDFGNLILGHEEDSCTWRYFNRKFEYEDMLQDFDLPWAGHKNFAYDLIRNVKPQTVVELGTYKGTSFFSFCQAVKDAYYNANLYAVDTWHGDEHAGFYDDNVFNEVKKIKEKYYGGIKVHLLRKSFDEAVVEFENDSIDLLHIDGLHTYAAVKHDFEEWLPKVKKEGIILLHDIFINRDDFGVYKFWEELKGKYKTVEFHHSYGLGVLLKDGHCCQTRIDREKELQIGYSCIAEDKKNEEIKKSLKTRDGQIKNLGQTIAALEQSLIDRDKQIAQIKDSNSWRITLPFREMRRWLAHPWVQIQRYAQIFIDTVRGI